MAKEKSKLRVAKEYLARANSIKKEHPIAVGLVGSEYYMEHHRCLLGYYDNLTEYLDDGYHDQQWNAACARRDRIFNEIHAANKKSGTQDTKVQPTVPPTPKAPKGNVGKDYVITGTLVSGARFAPIHTKTPQCYNIWRGTLWEVLPNGSRKKVRDYVN